MKGREEHGEKKRSKLRGGVESGSYVPAKSMEHAAKRGFPVAGRAGGDDFPHRLRDAHGMRACHSASLSPLPDAKLQMALHL